MRHAYLKPKEAARTLALDGGLGRRGKGGDRAVGGGGGHGDNVCSTGCDGQQG